mmetsp:Transcript_5370/g.8476  ORF Transcript_5370/g.8476 Transcript_5370/m.8476 type:complete len:143 (+) Transcript_5370:531-959(+)
MAARGKVYAHHDTVNLVLSSSRMLSSMNMEIKHATEWKTVETLSHPLMAPQEVPAAEGAAMKRKSMGCAELGKRHMSVRWPLSSRRAMTDIVWNREMKISNQKIKPTLQKNIAILWETVCVCVCVCVCVYVCVCACDDSASE